MPFARVSQAGKSAMDDMLVGSAAVDALFAHDEDLEDDEPDVQNKDDSDEYVMSVDGGEEEDFFPKYNPAGMRKTPRRGSDDDDDEAWMPANSRRPGVKLLAGVSPCRPCLGSSFFFWLFGPSSSGCVSNRVRVWSAMCRVWRRAWATP
jgi:hypothetical protein